MTVTEAVAKAGVRSTHMYAVPLGSIGLCVGLNGHLEQGRLGYEVIKNLGTGLVTFRVVGYSRPAPIRNPVIRLGFALFGRWTQQRFYRNIQARMAGLVATAQRGGPRLAPQTRPDGLVLAPAGVRPHPLEHLARAWIHP